MADQRSAFRFRLPWLPAASTPRPTTPRPPAQPTASTTTLATAPRRAAETQVPSQPTSTATPTPAQSPGNATPVPSQPTSTTTPTPAQSPGSASQVPSQQTSTTTRTPMPQSVDVETPTQPTTGTATPTITQQVQSTTATIPSSETPQKTETEAAPSPSVATQAPVPADTQTAQTQPISQSTIQTTPTPTNTRTAQTQPLSQPTATATATTSTERPPFRPPGATSPQASLPQPQASRTESQPSSPSRVTSQSRVSSQTASPSRATTQSRSSQPLAPSRKASQSQATSLLSSPSRSGTPNSPTPQKISQPRTQPRMASRPAGQTSSASPSGKAAQGQPTAASRTESIIPEQQPLEQLQTKEETKSGIIYDSQKQTPVETSTVPDEMALEPLKESGLRTTTILTPTGGSQTTVPTKKSDTPTRSTELESFPQHSKPEETKEVKEIMQETKEIYKEAIDKEDYLLPKGPASAMQTKEQLRFTSQSEQAQQPVDSKEVMPTPDSNRKETNTTAQPRNKNMSVDSSQKLAMTNGERIPLHNEIRDDVSKLVQKMASRDLKHSIDDRPVSVITLVGENRGATMHLGTDLMKKGGAVPIRRGYKVNPDESAETTTDGEGSFKVKSEDTKDIEDQAAEAFVNSNVQGINNSIMSNSSITERNPGVLLVHSRYPIKPKTSTAEKEFLEREKTEFSKIHAQRLTYEPMVRRRCLRGLFLESSDSDPENTAKPRRHGCRVGCEEKSKENNIDVF